MSVLTPPPEAHSSSAAAPSDSRRYEREEILAQDGVVEDIIAVDHKSTLVEFCCNTPTFRTVRAVQMGLLYVLCSQGGRVELGGRLFSAAARRHAARHAAGARAQLAHRQRFRSHLGRSDRLDAACHQQIRGSPHRR